MITRAGGEDDGLIRKQEWVGRRSVWRGRGGRRAGDVGVVEGDEPIVNVAVSILELPPKVEAEIPRDSGALDGEDDREVFAAAYVSFRGKITSTSMDVGKVTRS